MGLDWRDLSLSDYLETLEAFNEAHDPKAAKAPAEPGDMSDLKRLMRAHGGD